MTFPMRVTLRTAMPAPQASSLDPEAKTRTDTIPAGSTEGVASSMGMFPQLRPGATYFLVRFADEAGEWYPAWVREDMVDFPDGRWPSEPAMP